jgi:hypothetical protein
MIERYLADLEQRIDPEAEEALHASWKDFCDGTSDVELFSPKRPRKRVPTIEWPAISINAALDDDELMALHQFKLCSDAIAAGTGQLLNVRCNYGTGILSSVFGAELFIMDESLNSLPTTRPLAGGADDVERVIARGVPDLRTGWGGKVLDMARRYREWMEPYPRIRRYVNLYHPDLQSTMDICELLYGSELFTDLLENPDLIRRFLDLISQTYVDFMRAWLILVPPQAYATHWAMMHRGTIMLRDDSAMNLSPEMVAEFIRPYDQRLLDTFGGGAIHFCGRGDHYIEVLSAMRCLYAIHMSQPEMNDMEVIFRNTVDKNIRIIGLKREAAQHALDRGRDLRKCVHCW